MLKASELSNSRQQLASWESLNYEQWPIGEHDENIGFPASGLIIGRRWFVQNIAWAPFLCPSTPYVSFFLLYHEPFVLIQIHLVARITGKI